MIKVTVIAAQGAVLRGPVRVGLSKDQHALRASVLGVWRKGGVFDLDGSDTLSFKYGESFALQDPRGRLNRSLFDWEQPPAGQPVGDDTQEGGA